jgi:hypothetical protein
MMMNPTEATLAMDLLLAPPPLLPASQKLAQRLINRRRDNATSWQLLCESDPLWQLSLLPYAGLPQTKQASSNNFRMVATAAFQAPVLPTRLHPLAAQWQALGLATAAVAAGLQQRRPGLLKEWHRCLTIARIHHWGELLVWWRFTNQAEQALRATRSGQGNFSSRIKLHLNGYGAARLGRLWAASWQVPARLTRVIGTYEHPLKSKRDRNLALVIAISRRLAELAGYRGPGQLSPDPFPARWWQELNLTTDDLDAGLASLRDHEDACDIMALASQAA